MDPGRKTDAIIGARESERCGNENADGINLDNEDPSPCAQDSIPLNPSAQDSSHAQKHTAQDSDSNKSLIAEDKECRLELGTKNMEDGEMRQKSLVQLTQGNSFSENAQRSDQALQPCPPTTASHATEDASPVFKPLLHAGTGIVYSTGDCMHKGVKARRPSLADAESELQSILASEVEHRAEFCQMLVQHVGGGAGRMEGATVSDLMGKLQEQDGIVASLLQRCLEITMVSRRQRGDNPERDAESGYQSTEDIRRRAVRFSRSNAAVWRQLSSDLVLPSLPSDSGRAERKAMQHSDQSD